MAKLYALVAATRVTPSGVGEPFAAAQVEVINCVRAEFGVPILHLLKWGWCPPRRRAEMNWPCEEELCSDRLQKTTLYPIFTERYQKDVAADAACFAGIQFGKCAWPETLGLARGRH